MISKNYGLYKPLSSGIYVIVPFVKKMKHDFYLKHWLEWSGAPYIQRLTIAGFTVPWLNIHKEKLNIIVCCNTD